MTGESHVENLKAGTGGTGFQNPATENLLMAGFELRDVQTITSPNAPSDGVDAADFTLQAGNAVGSSSADGGELHLYGGSAQENGQAGDVIIRGGIADRVPGGAVIIEGGITLFGTGNTGAIIRLTTGAGGSSGNSGSMNITTANGNGTGDSGPISLRAGAGGTSGGDGGLIELVGGSATGTGGTGSAILIRSGTSPFSATGYSGDIDIEIGTLGNIGNAGTLNITGADGGTSGIGTTVNLRAGGSNVSTGGAVNLTTGSGLAGNVPGGDFTVQTGDAYGTTQHGGHVYVQTGDGVGTGDGGGVFIRPGVSAGSGLRGATEIRGAWGSDLLNNGTIVGSYTLSPDISNFIQMVWGAAAIGTLDIGNVKTDIGVTLTLEIENGGQGTLTWGTMVEWAGGSAPALTAAGRDLLRFMTRNGGSTWYGEEVALDLS